GAAIEPTANISAPRIAIIFVPIVLSPSGVEQRRDKARSAEGLFSAPSASGLLPSLLPPIRILAGVRARRFASCHAQTHEACRSSARTEPTANLQCCLG